MCNLILKVSFKNVTPSKSAEREDLISNPSQKEKKINIHESICLQYEIERSQNQQNKKINCKKNFTFSFLAVMKMEL